MGFGGKGWGGGALRRLRGRQVFAEGLCVYMRCFAREREREEKKRKKETNRCGLESVFLPGEETCGRQCKFVFVPC